MPSLVHYVVKLNVEIKLESVISPFFESSVWILIFYSPLPHEEACI